jgi:hypothetical protein
MMIEAHRMIAAIMAICCPAVMMFQTRSAAAIAVAGAMPEEQQHEHGTRMASAAAYCGRVPA